MTVADRPSASRTRLSKLSSWLRLRRPEQDHNFLGARYSADLSRSSWLFREPGELGLIRGPVDQLVSRWLVLFLKQDRVAINVDGRAWEGLGDRHSATYSSSEPRQVRSADRPTYNRDV